MDRFEMDNLQSPPGYGGRSTDVTPSPLLCIPAILLSISCPLWHTFTVKRTTNHIRF